MKLPLIKTEDVFKGEETETVPATFTKKALKQLRAYHQQGLKNEAWNLDEAHFIGWVSASGVVGLALGNNKENENEKKIKELEAEIEKLKKK